MSSTDLLRILFKLTALAAFIPLFFIALFSSNFLQNLLKKPIEALGAEDVNRMLAEKGIFAIFEFVEFEIVAKRKGTK